MGIPVALKQRTNSICKEGSGKYAEEKTKLVPGEGSGPNVCPFALSGWLRHESTPRKLHAKPFNCSQPSIPFTPWKLLKIAPQTDVLFQGCSKALTIVLRRLRAEVASEFEGLLGARARLIGHLEVRSRDGCDRPPLTSCSLQGLCQGGADTERNDFLAS